MSEQNVVFVVMSIDYAYNDEYYYRNETDGGSPQFYYLQKEEAEAKCQEMNLKDRSIYDLKDFENCGDRDQQDMNDIDFYQVVAVPLGTSTND